MLVVATSHGLLGDGPERTGLWLEELAVPYYALLDAGGLTVGVIGALWSMGRSGYRKD